MACTDTSTDTTSTQYLPACPPSPPCLHNTNAAQVTLYRLISIFSTGLIYLSIFPQCHIIVFWFRLLTTFILRPSYIRIYSLDINIQINFNLLPVENFCYDRISVQWTQCYSALSSMTRRAPHRDVRSARPQCTRWSCRGW